MTQIIVILTDFIRENLPYPHHLCAIPNPRILLKYL